jgi:hypothetical protein
MLIFMYIKIIRDMKKAKRVEFGIEIVKPWSKAMYDHNDVVAEAVKVKVSEMWISACSKIESEDEEFASNTDWLYASTTEMIKIQKAITCYGFGSGYDVAEVSRRVEQELLDAPLYRLKEIAEDLELELNPGFVGFR